MRLNQLRVTLTTRRIVVYLVADLALLVTLFVFDSTVRSRIMSLPVWYWPVMFIPFGLLTVFDNSNAPLVFNVRLSSQRILGYSIATCTVLAVVTILLGSALPKFEYPAVQGDLIGAVALSINAGVSEEAFKISIINIIARNLQRSAQNRIAKRDYLWISGICAVTAWAYLHVAISGYSMLQFTLALFGGFILYVALIRTKNVEVVMLSHILYDIVALFSFG